ncbi:hypothetical protein JCM6882_003003 [Rhodosporidiobolus microsporus]
MSISTAPSSEMMPWFPGREPQYDFTTVWGSSTWTPLVAAKFPLTWDNFKKWYTAPSTPYVERASFFVALLDIDGRLGLEDRRDGLFKPLVNFECVIGCSVFVLMGGMGTGAYAFLLSLMALEGGFTDGMEAVLVWCARMIAVALDFSLWALTVSLAASTVYLAFALLWFALCPLFDYLLLPVLLTAHSLVGLRPLQAALGTATVYLSLLGVDHFLPTFSASIPPSLRPALYALPTLCVVADVWAVSVSSRAAAATTTMATSGVEEGERQESSAEEVARLRSRLRELVEEAEA